MNEQEHELFEAELRQIQPARLPGDFAERLAAAKPEGLQRHQSPRGRTMPTDWSRLLRWLTPATAAASLVALALWPKAPITATPDALLKPQASLPLKADDVELDRQLIGTFETVATLADGEPVRLRCREWMDEVILRDTASGVAIQQRTPRFEIVPVRFETF